jgi:hypothetical protein
VARFPAPARDWRFLAQRITGDGQPGAWLHKDLPLTGSTVTEVLSGPTQIGGTIDPVYRRLQADDGRPLLDEWGTVIYAEADGQIRGASIYRNGDFDGPQWRLDCAGFAAYPTGMGYEGEYLRAPGLPGFVNTDPLDIVRHIWAHIQGGLYSDLGLAVDDSTTTPVRVGTADDPEAVAGATSDGPVELNEWSTDDLGSVIDDLASTTPFDYRERHAWNNRRDEVLHSLEFGYPRLGARRKLRFVLGENIQTIPTVTRDGAKFANHVRFLGAGEGRDMVRADSRFNDGRLRRMATVDDKSVTGRNHAFARAGRELTARQLLPNITDVVVRDTPYTPLGSWDAGDEIRIVGEVDWMPIDLWFRVVSVTVSPDQPETIGMSLLRSDMA